MRVHRSLVLATVVFAAGCAAPSPRKAESRPEIAPLTEAEFDLFAERIAYAVRARLDFFGGSTKASVIRPQAGQHAGGPAIVAADETKVPADAPADEIDRKRFAETLLAAVTDRMSGRITFVDSPPARYRSRLDFMPPVAGRGWIEFALIDPVTQRDVARERTDYALRRTAGAPAVTARHEKRESDEPKVTAEPRKSADAGKHAEPQEQKAGKSAPRSGETADSAPAMLKIDMSESELARAADDLAEKSPYGAWSVVLEHGKVVFLSEKSWSEVEISHPDAAQRVAGGGGAVRSEFRLAARAAGRTARTRTVFFDAHDRRVEVTPVLEYGLIESYPVIVAASARDSRAARFVTLVQVD